MTFQKSLWLTKYKPEVLTPPDASAKVRFETGNIVGGIWRTVIALQSISH